MKEAWDFLIAHSFAIPNDIEIQILRMPTEELMDIPFIRETAAIRTGMYKLH